MVKTSNKSMRRLLAVGAMLLLGVTAPSFANAAVHHHAATTTTTTTVPSFCATKPCLSTLITIPESKAGGYKPVAPAGATDLYRCSFFDPKYTSDQMIIGSTFSAQNHGTTAKPVIEIHHAILYQVPPNQVASAKALGSSWTCFGSPTPATSLAGLGAMPWAAAWAPGSSTALRPAGYGTPVEKGSGYILQIHYNLLVADVKDNSSMNIITTPAATSGLTALQGWQLVAPPDLPCPTGVEGTLCNKANSVADLGKRFGSSSVQFDSLIEMICKATTGSDPNWQTATSTSCIWQWPKRSSAVTLHTVGAHMHLLGKTLSLDLCHTDATCTNSSKVRALFVNSYNFDNQQSYPIAPTVLHPGDYVKVTCTYDPKLRAFNPQTKKLPPRFIVWGDGSSDEMCLSTVGYSEGAGS